MSKQIIVVTVTYDRPNQIQYLKRCADMMLQAIRNGVHIKWLVIEDSDQHNEAVHNLLDSYDKRYTQSRLEIYHWFYGPTKKLGHAQKAFAIKEIRNRHWRGNVVFFDDDNMAHWKHFMRCSMVDNFGIWRVNNVSIRGTEGPVVDESGVIFDFDGGFRSRKFAIDTAGFAIDSRNLTATTNGFLSSNPEHNWEDTFLSELFAFRLDAEPFGNGKICYVSHNEPLNGECEYCWSVDRQPLIFKIDWEHRIDTEINSRVLGQFRTLALTEAYAIEMLRQAINGRFKNNRYTSVHKKDVEWNDILISQIQFDTNEEESSW